MVFKIRIGFGLDHIGSDSDFKIYQLSDWELPIRSDAHLYSVTLLIIFQTLSKTQISGNSHLLQLLSYVV